ncbi:hypothetical protein ACYFX5_04310 [Bremerella sp. T1]|nr:hypothetical protein [Bremerella volcania]
MEIDPKQLGMFGEKTRLSRKKLVVISMSILWIITRSYRKQ